MSNRHWMPLDIGDYLRDTGHLTVAEHGAYMLLIMRYWSDGGLPDDERLIARYSRMTPEQWAESRDVLFAFFDAGWKHRRIDTEIAKADDLIGKRRAAAEHRHSKSNAHAEQVQSNSSDTGVPPSPLPLPRESSQAQTPPVGRERESEFNEVWADFPRHPNSRRQPAFRAFSNLPVIDRLACIRGAARYAMAFEDDRADKRPMQERLRYVPHLVTWIHQRGWEAVLEQVA